MKIGPKLDIIQTNAWLAYLCLGLASIPFIKFDWFFEPHDTSKWMTLYLTAAGSLLLIGLRKNISLPRSNVFWLFACSFLLHSIAQVFFHNLNFSSSFIIGRLCFFTLIILFFNINNKDSTLGFITLPIISSTVAIISLYWIHSHGGEEKYSYAPLFGNINMVAQFCGLTVLLLLYSSRKFSKFRVAFEITAAIAATQVYYSICRSVSLALILGSVSLIFIQRNYWKSIIRVGAITLALSLTLSMFSQVKDSQFEDHWKFTKNSKNYRLALWESAFDMFVDNPLGIGPGRLSYSVIPYKIKNGHETSELQIDSFMHNEYLRFLVEDGPFLLLLLAISALLFLWSVLQIKNKELKAILIATSTFLAVESLFQFPFMLPIPFVSAALMISLVLRQQSQSGTSAPSQSVIKSIVLMTAAILFVLSFRNINSEYLSYLHRSSEEKITAACSYNTENWRACLFAGNIKIEKGKYKEGEKYFYDLIEKQPGNFTAYKHLSKSAFRQGDWDRGCKYLKKYDELLSGKSSLHQWMHSKCQF